MTKNYQFKLLKRAYKKSLKELRKTFFSNNKTGLFLFVEYLKYLRKSVELLCTR